MSFLQKFFILILIVTFFSCGCLNKSSSVSMDKTPVSTGNIQSVTAKTHAPITPTPVDKTPTSIDNISKLIDKNIIISEHIFKGSGIDVGASVAISPDGIVWVIGIAESDTEPGSIPPSKHKESDVWLIGIDPKKSKGEQIIYNRCFGGDGSDAGYDIAVAQNGIVWIVGGTNSSAGRGDIPKSKYENLDAWLLGIDPKKNDSNQIIYNRCFGGNNQDLMTSITLSQDDIIWLSGETNSTGGKGDIPLSKHKDNDGWLLGIDPKKSESKQIVYNRCFGGDENDKFSARALVIDKNGTLWLTATTDSSPDTGDVPQSKHEMRDIWVLGIDPPKSESEQIVYNRCFGGNGDETSSSIVVDSEGILWVLGDTSSNAPNDHLSYDIWLLGLDPKKSEDKQIIYNRCFGNNAANDESRVMAVDKNGTLWLVGTANGTESFSAWIAGINPRKSENEQIVYNRLLDKESYSNVLGIAVDKNSIWMTGIFKQFPGNKKSLDKPDFGLWIVGLKY